MDEWVLLALALVVTCTPARVVRAANVACSARLEPIGPMTVTELRAESERNVLRDPAEKHAAGEYVWSGIAVADTRVRVTVRSFSGETLTGSSGFSVAPRQLPHLAVPDARPAWEYGEDSLFGGWPPRVAQASSPADPITADGSLGALTISLSSPRTRYVEEGPNARWFYVSEPVPQPVVRVFLSRALKPADPFYLLQNGGPVVALRPGCARADLDVLRDRVLEHEGALPSDRPSHFGETRKAFEERDVQGEVEEMRLFYDQALAGDPLQRLVGKKLQNFLDALRIDQRETVDARAPVRLPCRLHYP